MDSESLGAGMGKRAQSIRYVNTCHLEHSLCSSFFQYAKSVQYIIFKYGHDSQFFFFFKLEINHKAKPSAFTKVLIGEKLNIELKGEM